MGTVHWQQSKCVPKRQRKFSLHQVPEALAESRWKCQTCPGVIASAADIYCIHCKIYWEDVSNGLFSD